VVAALVEGRLVCEVCRKSPEFDLVVKRGEARHFCKRCRKLNPCERCGTWKRILVHDHGQFLCAKCAR
jgi:hypothetical protein